MRQRRRASHTLLFTCLLAVAVMVPTSARGDYFGGPHMDDSTMDFYYSPALSAARKTGLEDARKFAVAPTDVTTVVHSTYKTYRDVWAMQAAPKCPPYGTAASCDTYKATDPFYTYPTAYAVTVCLYKAGGRCDQSRVAFDTLQPHSNFASLACHELGHVLGFDDGENNTYGPNSAESNTANRSCMRNRPDWEYYSHDHDWVHINAKY